MKPCTIDSLITGSTVWARKTYRGPWYPATVKWVYRGSLGSHAAVVFTDRTAVRSILSLFPRDPQLRGADRPKRAAMVPM